jgi:hypothetical protein
VRELSLYENRHSGVSIRDATLTRRRATPLKVAERTQAERTPRAALSQPVPGLEAVAAG